MGMKKEELPERKRMRLETHDYATPGYYFVTVCTRVRHKNILSYVSAVGGGLCAAPSDLEPPLQDGETIFHPAVKLTPIGEIVDRAIRDIPCFNPGVGVDIYCIMPDHVHLIITLSGRHGGRPLQEIMARMKSYTQTEYRKIGAPWGPKLWQESYYDHIIRNNDDLFETRKYIQENPLK